MAYIRKLTNGKYRAEVERNGVRDSAVRDTRAEAKNWGAAREAELLDEKRGKRPVKTLAQAIERYLVEISSGKQGRHFEELRFTAIVRDFPALCGKQMSEIDTPDWAAWRDARLKTVSAGTVHREVNLFRNVFTVARVEWKWIEGSPFEGLRLPPDNAPRDRRIHWREVKRICRWLGYRGADRVETLYQQTAYAFLLALRTGMRAAELRALKPSRLDLKARVATVPHKMQYLTRKEREVPLARAAVRLLTPRMHLDSILTIGDALLSALFHKAVYKLMIDDLHFHDSRAEALTRFARKVDVMTLARISGHKDINLLHRVYYRESAADIAGRLAAI